MTETKNNNDIIEKITNGVISYLNFVKKIKQVNKEDIIQNKQNNNSKLKYFYIFRDFNLDCYIIKKNYFDDFRSSINFNVLIEILNTINDENIKRFKKELKNILDKKPYKQNGENIKVYSDEEELKEIMKNFNDYTLINKELLCDVMGVPEFQLENNKLKFSKSEKNSSLLSVLNNYMITINVEKNKEKIEEEKKNKGYKNLYYVGDITKKILILLYFYEEKIKKKIQNQNKDIYKFKKYYLINSSWLNEYKEFFSYDMIKKKLDKKFKDYSYNRIKTELNDISKKAIGQIKLYGESTVSDNIRDASKLKVENNIIQAKCDTEEIEISYGPKTPEPDMDYEIPEDFELINEDIFELLMKEEFFYNMNEEIKDKLSYDVLLGNNQIVIKNKLNDNKIEVYNFFNYLIFTINKDFNNEQNTQIQKYILKFILDYEKSDIFFNNYSQIIEKGIGEYIKNNNFGVTKEDKKFEQKIMDKKKNILGKFIDIDINENDVQNNFDNNNIITTKKENENINKNKLIKYEIEFKNEIQLQYDIKNTKQITFNNLKSSHNINISYLNNKESLEKKDLNNTNSNNIKNIKYVNNIDKISINYTQPNNENNNISKNNIINVNENTNMFIFDKLKEITNLLEIIIYNNNNINNIEEKNKYELKSLYPKEIIDNINENKLKKILLIIETSLNNIKSIINNDLLNKYINSNREEKYELLKNNENEFSNINKMSKDFLSTNNYVKSSEDIINNNKYLIIQNLEQNTKDINIYYFSYENNLYIFFEKEKSIFQLIPQKDNLFILKKYENYKLQLLKYINNIINKNRDINNINLEEVMKDNNNYIKEYYLINNNWLKLQIDSEEKKDKEKDNLMVKEKIYPKTLSVNVNDKMLEYLKYPVDLGFLEKRNNESFIKELGIKDNNINVENYLISKIFIVKWQNNIPKEKLKSFDSKAYIGIIDNKNQATIYFYLIDKDKYTFEFLIQFYDETIMIEEIYFNIKEKGIGLYLNEMGVDFSTKNNYDLINNNLEIIGNFINCTENNEYNLYKQIASNGIKYIEYSGYLNGVIIGLMNLEPIKNLFFDKSKLINMIDKDSVFTKYFYEIFQELHYLKKEDENKVENLCINFMKTIQEISKDSHILENIKSLIEFLLLKLHNEQNKKNKNFITTLDKMYKTDKDIKEFYKINESFIQESFFFEMELDKHCYFCYKDIKEYYMCCTLNFNIEQLYRKYKNNNIISFYNILDNLNLDTSCPFCGEPIRLLRQFNECPDYLIIIIDDKQNNIEYQFDFKEEVNINNYICNTNLINKTKYKLIYFIQNEMTSFLKYNHEWYKYEGNKVKTLKSINQKLLPYLLVYKNIKNNK